MPARGRSLLASLALEVYLDDATNQSKGISPTHVSYGFIATPALQDVMI